MNVKKIFKVIGIIVALAGIACAAYFAVQKLLAPKEPEYFDDNDFFECDNELEIIEATPEEEPKEEPKPQKKAAPKKKAAKKPAKKED